MPFTSVDRASTPQGHETTQTSHPLHRSLSITTAPLIFAIIRLFFLRSGGGFRVGLSSCGCTKLHKFETSVTRIKHTLRKLNTSHEPFSEVQSERKRPECRYSTRSECTVPSPFLSMERNSSQERSDRFRYKVCSSVCKRSDSVPCGKNLFPDKNFCFAPRDVVSLRSL